MLQKESHRAGRGKSTQSSLVPPTWNVPGCYDTARYTHTHGGNLCALRSYIYNSPVYKHLLLSGLLILSPWSTAPHSYNPSSILPCGQRLYKKALDDKNQEVFNTRLTYLRATEQERGEQRGSSEHRGRRPTHKLLPSGRRVIQLFLKASTLLPSSTVSSTPTPFT